MNRLKLSFILTLLLTVNTIGSTGTPSSSSKEEENGSEVKVRPSVIVIGAGCAGIATASELIKTGEYDVRVFEGSDRIGGRIHRQKLGNYFVELGAEWVHGEKGNKVWELMKDSGLLINKEVFESSLLITSKGEVLSDELAEWVNEVQDDIMLNPIEPDPTKASKRESVESTAEVAKRIFDKALANKQIKIRESLKNGIFHLMHARMNSWDGSDDWNFSTQNNSYITSDGNQNIQWKYPAMYFSFLKYLLTGNGGGDPGDLRIPPWIHLNKKVTRVTFVSDNDEILNKTTVEVAGETEPYTADHVIFTPSLGVLKQNWRKLFYEQLKEKKIRAIEKLGFGTVNKIFLEFREKWWSPESLEIFSPVWDDDFEESEDYIRNPFWKINGSMELLGKYFDHVPIWVRSVNSFIISAQNPNALECFITGSASRYLEKLPRGHIIAGIMPLLRRLFNDSTKNNRPIEDPINVLTSKWVHNEFILGSYSYATVESQQSQVSAKDLAEPILDSTGKPVLCFAGEATSIHQYSTVHGAYESGIREAKRIIEYYHPTVASSAADSFTNLFNRICQNILLFVVSKYCIYSF